MTFTNFLFLVGGIYAVYYISIMIYELFFKNKTVKDYDSFSVANYQEEEPVLVTNDYIYKQSGLTKNEYEQRMALYRKSRTKKIEEDLEIEIKRDLKKESSIDDELGMSF